MLTGRPMEVLREGSKNRARRARPRGSVISSMLEVRSRRDDTSFAQILSL